MSLVKILDINVDFIGKASSEGFVSSMNHEIEEILSGLVDMETLPYNKTDIIQLIGSIEKYKMDCINGGISAKRLYRDVDYALSLFKIKHPEFDYLKDPVLNAYFS
jgi:hypothetical protein